MKVRRDVRGLRDQWIRVAFPETLGVWQIRVYTMDDSRNVSCPSKVVRIDKRPAFQQMLAYNRALREQARILHLIEQAWKPGTR